MARARTNQHGGLPIKLGPCSNGEFVPRPASPVVRETIRRASRAADEHAARLGVSRRAFLASSCGSALTLLTLAACSNEAGQATQGAEPGGTFTLPPTSTTEPEVATSVLADDTQFVMDVQGHLLEYDLTPDEPWDGTFYTGQMFPQANCGEDDPRACFSIESFLDLYFLQSDTSLVVLSAIPVFESPSPLSPEVMAQTRAIAAALCDHDRILAHGMATPNVGDVEEQLAAMADLRAEFDVSAWKMYPHIPASTPFRFDDADPSLPQIGGRFLDQVRQVGPPIVCVHKGISSVGGGYPADPADIGPAAVDNPDISFVVYHSGYELAVSEGPYDPADPNGGIDRLLVSCEAAGVGPGANVYAELGSTWRSVMGDPDQAAHTLGKLLVAFGEDRVVWGTDSIWYGSPQDQIEAFRAFEITEQFQEQYGYPALTDEVKDKILGLNSAELYGVDPTHVDCEFTGEELRTIRQEVAPEPVTLGPVQAAEVDALLVAHA
ncbi:MAG: amidohydrolase [Acidimicrobiia bacterium]|nr:amidohydrolase [Acidimicrobiia bacterium]